MALSRQARARALAWIRTFGFPVGLLLIAVFYWLLFLRTSNGGLAITNALIIPPELRGQEIETQASLRAENASTHLSPAHAAQEE